MNSKRLALFICAGAFSTTAAFSSNLSPLAAEEAKSELVIKITTPPAPSAGTMSLSDSTTKTSAKSAGTISPLPQRKPTEDPIDDFIHQGHFIHRNELAEAVAEGEYHQGKRIGRWTRWYRPGEGDMFSGELYEQFTRPFVAEVEFDNGQFVGPWMVSDAEGRKIGQWNLNEQHRPHGKSTWWYPNGQKMREVDYVDGLVHGKIQQWDESGQPRVAETYDQGRLVKSQTEYYTPPDKRTQGDFLKAGQVQRCTVDWWAGKVNMQKVADYPKDEMHGVWTAWYPDGQLQTRGEYDCGVPSGKFTWWYPSGQTQIEGHYTAGKQSGQWDWYYEVGMKQRRGHYRNGEPTGRWTSYNEDGTLREVEENYTADTPSQTLAAVDPLAPQKTVVAQPRPAAAKSIVVTDKAPTPKAATPKTPAPAVAQERRFRLLPWQFDRHDETSAQARSPETRKKLR